MAITKKEQKQQKDLQDLMPKVADVAAKDLTKLTWNPNLFNREKSYKTSQDEKANFKVVRATWRKLIIEGRSIVAVEGGKVSKADYEVFKGYPKATQEKYFIGFESKKKPKKVEEVTEEVKEAE
jgi:hypothetical protein